MLQRHATAKNNREKVTHQTSLAKHCMAVVEQQHKVHLTIDSVGPGGSRRNERTPAQQALIKPTLDSLSVCLIYYIPPSTRSLRYFVFDSSFPFGWRMSKAREAFRDWISTQKRKKNSEGKPNGISKKHIMLLRYTGVCSPLFYYHFFVFFFYMGITAVNRLRHYFQSRRIFNLMGPFVLYGRATTFMTSTQVVQSDEFPLKMSYCIRIKFLRV